MHKMEKRLTELQDAMSENNSALMAGSDLSDFIERLDLPTSLNNKLIRLIDHYRTECEGGMYLKGAKEKPRIEEYTNGVLTDIYNDDGGPVSWPSACDDCRKKIRAIAETLPLGEVSTYLVEACCDGSCREDIVAMIKHGLDTEAGNGDE